MSKFVSVGLIAAAMFATPAMADWVDKNGVVVHESRVVHCIRAPDVGQFDYLLNAIVARASLIFSSALLPSW